jgi:hypothetical protein
MISKAAIIVLLTVSMLSEASYAEKTNADVIDVAAIEDGEGNARILFHWNSPITAEYFAIQRATLKFDVLGEAESRVLRLRFHPVTTAWTAGNVSWSSGWSEPGGDFDEDIVSSTDLDLSKGEATVFVDVSNVLKETLEIGQDLHGFLVTTDPTDATGIKEADIARFEGLASGSLEVTWRKVPAKPIELQQDDSADSD